MPDTKPRINVTPPHKDSSLIHPLDVVSISVQGEADFSALTVAVEDAARNQYLCEQNVDLNAGPFSFTVKGALGMHTLSVCKNNKLVAEKQFEVTAETEVKTGNVMYDTFYPRMEAFLVDQERSAYVNAQKSFVKGYSCPDGDTPMHWLRDHVYQLFGAKYYDHEIKSEIDFFFKNQLPDGTFYDYLMRDKRREMPTDYFSVSMVIPDESFFLARCTVEADVEFLAVTGVHLVWQATGDDNWMRSKLDAMDKALESYWKLPHRWSTEYNLVKRPFTIDTWDFEYGTRVTIGDKTYHRANIDDKTKFGIMHGDNTGLASACAMLARMYAYFGDAEKSEYWQKKGAAIMANLNKISWNGAFFTHQVHIDPVKITEVDESKQLSLSNALALTRGVLTESQAHCIILEYQKRGRQGNYFADWISLDPPFPYKVFNDVEFLKPGVYVNGGVMPFIGGALTYGAFENGFEKYAVENLVKYYKLIEVTGETYLDYEPDGSIPTRPVFPHDGWGPAFMTKAFIEGLAGVKDTGIRYSNVELTPRWSATDVTDAKVVAKYGASNGYFAYAYNVDTKKKTLSIETSSTAGEIRFHVLMPERTMPTGVTVNGCEVEYTLSKYEESLYADFEVNEANIRASILFE